MSCFLELWRTASLIRFFLLQLMNISQFNDTSLVLSDVISQTWRTGASYYRTDWDVKAIRTIMYISGKKNSLQFISYICMCVKVRVSWKFPKIFPSESNVSNIFSIYRAEKTDSQNSQSSGWTETWSRELIVSTLTMQGKM